MDLNEKISYDINEKENHYRLLDDILNSHVDIPFHGINPKQERR